MEGRLLAAFRPIVPPECKKTLGHLAGFRFGCEKMAAFGTYQGNGVTLEYRDCEA